MVTAANAQRLEPNEQYRIRPYRAPVAIVLQTKLETPEKSGSFLIIDGMTRCLFDRGMEFYCNRDLDDRTLCVFMTHPESSHRFFEIEVVRKQHRTGGRIRYTAIFRRMLNTADLDEFDELDG